MSSVGKLEMPDLNVRNIGKNKLFFVRFLHKKMFRKQKVYNNV